MTLSMTLTRQQFRRMNELLREALEREEPERRAWLDSLGPENEDLLPALRKALLYAEQGLPDKEFLPSRIHFSTAPAPSRLDGLAAGSRIGPYALIRELGAGGMAEVWLAERVDGAYQREVALKLPSLVRTRKDLAQRFVRERDILAALEHPNIARLYDAGVAADGLPYLAMEYVPGVPITAWCDAQRLPVAGRVELFLQILDAAQYAHERKVLHRDIKPSNILVTGPGQVRLLDFGIAKLFDEQDSQLTRLYGRVLTPDYASPEQLRGDPGDARSDIYMLGVVLFELLAGERPYRLESGAVSEAPERASSTSRAQRPSTQIGEAAALARATTVNRLARGLRGDLDSVVLKALEPEASDRYASAAELAGDLRRYLDGESVLARRPPPGLRLARLVSRHRVASAMAAVAALSLAALLAMLARHDAREAGTFAAGAGEKSIAVLPFVDMSEKRDQEYFSDGLTEELINRLARGSSLKVIARTSTFQFKDKAGDVRAIGVKLGVANVLEGSVRKFQDELRISTQLVRVTDGAHLWSQTYDRRSGDIFQVQEDIAEAVAGEMQSVLSRGQAVPDSKSGAAYDAVLRGRYYLRRTTREDSQRAIEILRDAIRAAPGDPLPWTELALAYNQQGLFGWIAPKAAFRNAHAAVERALALRPDLAAAHRILAAIEWNFDFDFAKSITESRIARQLDPSDRTVTSQDVSEASAMGRTGDAVRLARRLAEGDPLDVFKKLYLASTLFDDDQLEEAERVTRNALELDPQAAGAYNVLGQILLARNKVAEALAIAPKEPDEGNRLQSLADALWVSGRHKEADAQMAKLRDKYGNELAYEIGASYALRGDKDAAFVWLNRAYENRQAQVSFLRSDRLLRGLRDDPRFQSLLQRLKLGGDGVGTV